MMYLPNVSCLSNWAANNTLATQGPMVDYVAKDYLQCVDDTREVTQYRKKNVDLVLRYLNFFPSFPEATRTTHQ